MTSVLQVQILGGFHLRYDDALVTDISSPRLQSLLSYLLLNADTPLSRRQFAFQLWPDSSDSQARGNLRRELSTLRHKLPAAEQFLQIKGQVVQWHPDAPCTLPNLQGSIRIWPIIGCIRIVCIVFLALNRYTLPGWHNGIKG
jgi:hypothetical protein